VNTGTFKLSPFFFLNLQHSESEVLCSTNKKKNQLDSLTIHPQKYNAMPMPTHQAVYGLWRKHPQRPTMSSRKRVPSGEPNQIPSHRTQTPIYKYISCIYRSSLPSAFCSSSSSRFMARLLQLKGSRARRLPHIILTLLLLRD
jgi:hypothetical protein